MKHTAVATKRSPTISDMSGRATRSGSGRRLPRTLELSARKVMAYLLLPLTVVSLVSSCSRQPDSEGQIAVAQSRTALEANGSWKANATWTFASTDRPVVMRGAGRWSDGGTSVDWVESWGSVTVRARTEGDMLVTEEGDRFRLSGSEAKKRLTSDLFYQLEPLELVASSGAAMTQRTTTNELNQYHGRGDCPAGPCRLSLTMTNDPITGAPAVVNLRVDYDNTWVVMNYEYKLD